MKRSTKAALVSSLTTATIFGVVGCAYNIGFTDGLNISAPDELNSVKLQEIDESNQNSQLWQEWEYTENEDNENGLPWLNGGIRTWICDEDGTCETRPKHKAGEVYPIDPWGKIPGYSC